MEVIVGDFDLEWERKDGVVHKADYDDLIKMYEKQEEHDKEIRNKVIDGFANTLLNNDVIDKSVIRRVCEQMKEVRE